MVIKRKKNLLSLLKLKSKNKIKKKEIEQKYKSKIEEKYENLTDVIEIPKYLTKSEKIQQKIIENKNVKFETETTKNIEIISLNKHITTLQIANEQKKILLTKQQKEITKENFFSRLRHCLLKTRQNIGIGFISFFLGKKINDDLFEKLEEQLLIADVGLETTRKIINNLISHSNRNELNDSMTIYNKLYKNMRDILINVNKPLIIENKLPYIILMVGVNGVGKTTTIAKLAHQYQIKSKSVMLAAGDTFRAAAIEQLQVLGERNNIPVVARCTGVDPSSVIFDAIKLAKTKKIDILIADTAGRLQNKTHLMEELKKIVRVIRKLDRESPHEIMLTLDASTGQNSINQAKIFNQAIGLTGLVLTKLDGTAKGGVIFAIADQFQIPIRYIGIGESIDDLRPFVADDFIKALFI
ncbi:MAG: signal recognition particle-docking protein FtsY [Arsenophonus sp. ER-BJ3-MAG3]